MLSRLSLPVRLGLLVAGTTLPLILFAGGITYFNYLHAQREAFETVSRVTRGIRLVLDREMNGIVSGLTVLASSRSLANDDFDNFRIGADAFLSRFAAGSSIVIGDRDGRQIFNSALPKGAPLPPRAARPEREEVFRIGQPVFSSLFYGSVSKRPILTVAVPVFRNGQVIYDLSFNPPIEIFQHIIEQQAPSNDWTISIFDQTGINFARIPNPERTFGKKAAPTLLAILFSSPEGQAHTVSLEGVPLLAAYSRSEITGWVPSAGVAESTLIAPLLRTVALTTLIGTMMLAIGLTFAIRMATQIARAESLHTLLINELNHRVKNTLATVQSLAAQTFRSSGDDEAKQKFTGRLVSLGRTHDVLSEEKWAGANIAEVIEGVMAPYSGSGRDRIAMDGSEIRLSSRTAVMVAMVLHELATNAAKYGALSGSKGKVSISWTQAGTADAPSFQLRWQESNGPAVPPPQRSGFGSTLIQHGVSGQLGGKAALSFEPAGVVCIIEVPLR